MKKDRELLEKEILEARDTISRKNIQDRIEEDMIKELKEYMTREKISQFILGLVPVNALDDNELYYISSFLLKEELIKVQIEDFFDEEEIKLYNASKISYERMYDDDKLVIDNASEVKTGMNRQFITTMSYRQIAQLFEEGVVGYNFATQRKGKIIATRGKIIRTATINKRNVENICKEILDGRFESNMITFNIRKTGLESFNYDDKTKTLSIIRSKSMIDVVDGYHRTKAINMAWKKNPRIEGSMIVCIKNLTVDEARLFIWQEAKGTVNNLDEMSLYDMDSNIAKLVNDINRFRNPNNVLYNKISTGENDNENTLIYYEIFAENLKRSWNKELEDARISEIGKIKTFICDFYAYAYDYIMSKFKVKTLEELEDSIVLNPMFMCGFLHAAKRMWYVNNETIDEKMIEKMIRILDLSSDYRKNKYIYTNIDDRYEFEKYKDNWEKLI